MATSIGRRKPKDVVFGDDLTIEWRDGEVSHYPFFGLRDVCPCAGCVHQFERSQSTRYTGAKSALTFFAPPCG
ncbi:MAG: DUF971 domain-containing protein [SAR324 cluster bacterium]|nr:DUF971 domain-containing protein [SAR324 cluster bacterium]